MSLRRAASRGSGLKFMSGECCRRRGPENKGALRARARARVAAVCVWGELAARAMGGGEGRRQEGRGCGGGRVDGRAGKASMAAWEAAAAHCAAEAAAQRRRWPGSGSNEAAVGEPSFIAWPQ